MKSLINAVCQIAFRLVPWDVSGAGRHQTRRNTWSDRYPEIFAAACEHLSGGSQAQLRILSYGCSTGEECTTLRRYFPGALIVGAEVDRRSLAACRWGNRDRGIRYIFSNERNISALAPYDAIFCMSVLCRWPDSKDISDIGHLYPFERYEGALEFLDAQLRVGGLLSIYNANFTFCDSPLYERYKVVDVRGLAEPPLVRQFGRDNRPKTGGPDMECLFRKER